MNKNLVSPPTEEEKYLFLTQNKGVLYFFSVLSFLLLIIGMIFFSRSHPYLYLFIPWILVLSFYLSISYVVGVFGKPFHFKNHESLKNTYRHGYEPSVDIYLPVCGEDVGIIENTFGHVSQIDYGNHKVYVLDDGRDPRVMDLSERYKFSYITRPNPGEHKKAGNLRYAFTQTKGEFILVFDADFCPRKDFIKETIFYFNHDEKIAIVQTPQFFNITAGQTWIQKGTAFVQELFYRLIQTNRNTWGASICVGTNAIYRRKALEPFGGTALINYSEDLHTGFNCLVIGYKVLYIPINLAQGLCPDKLDIFFSQQYRWAMGSITLFFNPEFWRAPLPIMVRVSYLSGMLYCITTGLGIFMTPLPGLIMVFFFTEYVYWYNVIFSLPSFLVGTFYMAFWAKLPWGVRVMKVRQVSYYAHLFAFVDKLRGNLMEWVPTGQVNHRSKRFKTFKATVCVWSFICLILSLYGVHSSVDDIGILNLVPFLFFQSLNFYVSVDSLRSPKDGPRLAAAL